MPILPRLRLRPPGWGASTLQHFQLHEDGWRSLQGPRENPWALKLAVGSQATDRSARAKESWAGRKSVQRWHVPLCFMSSKRGRPQHLCEAPHGPTQTWPSLCSHTHAPSSTILTQHWCVRETSPRVQQWWRRWLLCRNRDGLRDNILCSCSKLPTWTRAHQGFCRAQGSFRLQDSLTLEGVYGLIKQLSSLLH